MNEEIKKIIKLINDSVEKGNFGTADEHRKTLKVLLDNENQINNKGHA